MARTRPPDFMDRLIDAGLKVFGRKGLKAARMSDVARELGVSQGTLYNYVESKEALFGLLVERGADTEPVELPSELPVAAPPPETLRRRLENRMQQAFGMPRLEAALARDAVDDTRAELTAIVEELFARTEATRGPADALERSALDLPELFQTFFLGFRRRLFERYTRYVTSRSRSGAFRSDLDPRVGARFLVETVTFFARHRHRDPDPTLLPDADTIRASVIPMIVEALLAPSPDSPRA
jgi:AcrR family transcriptional regulator